MTRRLKPRLQKRSPPPRTKREIRRRQCRVPTVLFWVGTRHCRLLYIIPAQPDLILPMAFRTFSTWLGASISVKSRIAS